MLHAARETAPRIRAPSALREPGVMPLGFTADSNEISRANGSQSFEDFRNQWPKFAHAVCLCDSDHNGDSGRADVLLKLEILVDRQKYGESSGHHDVEQRAIALSGPSHIDDVVHVMPDQVALEWSRDTLIEQH